MPVLCALIGPSIREQIISLPTAHPRIEQLPISHAPHMQWYYNYLYPRDHSHFFYVCGIKKTLLLQYQLLAINNGFDTQLVTTERNALLTLYRSLFGSAFRHSHLGVDMSHRNNIVEHLFSRDDLARILSISPNHDISAHDTIPLLTSCGLFLSGEYA